MYESIKNTDLIRLSIQCLEDILLAEHLSKNLIGSSKHARGFMWSLNSSDMVKQSAVTFIKNFLISNIFSAPPNALINQGSKPLFFKGVPTAPTKLIILCILPIRDIKLSKHVSNVDIMSYFVELMNCSKNCDSLSSFCVILCASIVVESMVDGPEGMRPKSGVNNIFINIISIPDYDSR